MSKLEEYSDFRGGVLYHVGNVKPTTVASWGLELGHQRGDGHKRYDLIDVLAVALMIELTVANRMMASRAAEIVNQLKPRLRDVVEAYETEKRARRKWRWMGGPFAVISSDRENNPRQRVIAIVDEKTLALACSKNEQGFSLLVIPLPRLINKVTLGLDLVFSGSDPFFAPESAGE